MPISNGDRVPSGEFDVMTENGPGKITSDELFAGRKVVLVSVPGAFTPTCSLNHLPGFVEHAAEIMQKGVDTIACMAVNDVYVMNAWGKDRQVGDKIMMLADGNGDYTRELGLEVDASRFGLGMRGKRFAMVVDDGIVRHIAVEAPGKFEVSKAEAILAKL